MALKFFAAALLVVSANVGASVGTSAPAAADNTRLNNSTFTNIYTMQRQAGCTTDPKLDGRLVDAARRHALDAVNNPAINADLGSDGSTAQSRANPS